MGTWRARAWAWTQTRTQVLSAYTYGFYPVRPLLAFLLVRVRVVYHPASGVGSDSNSDLDSDLDSSSDSDSELAGDALVVPVPDTTQWTPGRCIVFLNSFNIIYIGC